MLSLAKKREENIAKRERERNKLKPAGEEKKKRRAKSVVNPH